MTKMKDTFTAAATADDPDPRVDEGLVRDFAAARALFRQLRTKEAETLAEIKRLSALPRSTPSTPVGTSRVEQLLADPSAPLADSEPDISLAEQIDTAWIELAAVRKALWLARRPYGALRTKIQVSLAEKLRPKYVAIVGTINSALLTLESALDSELSFHRTWAERGFPLWSWLTRACLPQIAAAGWTFRHRLQEELGLTVTELETICNAREQLAVESSNLPVYFPNEETDVSFPAETIQVRSPGRGVAIPRSASSGPGFPRGTVEVPSLAGGAPLFPTIIQ